VTIAGREDIAELLEPYLASPELPVQAHAALALKTSWPDRYRDLDLAHYVNATK
jgi:hypothetical protein